MVDDHKSSAPDTSWKILCVEDQPDTCELISAILHDCEVISASTCEQAMQTFRNDSFDMVLMDFHLPDGDGIDLCKQIRNINGHTPLIFVTGSANITHHIASAAGAQGVLLKATHDFMEQLRNYVDRFCQRPETA